MMEVKNDKITMTNDHALLIYYLLEGSVEAIKYDEKVGRVLDRIERETAEEIKGMYELLVKSDMFK